MPVCPARNCALLLVCATGLTAVDNDASRDFTWEELQAGRDIKEGIYNRLSGGEFDEWRLHLGVHPGLDRIQLKNQVAGIAYPGPAYVETDRVVNDPALPMVASFAWILGDFDAEDQGWFYGMGLDYVNRNYRVLYGVGTASADLAVHSLGLGLQMGYAWYLNPRVRFEAAPTLGFGLMWNQIDSVDLQTGFQKNQLGAGGYLEGGGRAALVWHPARTQAWHLGFEVTYTAGYGQTSFHTKDNSTGIETSIDSEVRLWWAGFGGALFYGHRF